MKVLISFSLLDNKTKISWTNNSKIGDTGTLEVCTCTACIWEKVLFSDVNKAWMFFFIRYHYYGIGIKETSTYYHSVYSGKGLTRFVVVPLPFSHQQNRTHSFCFSLFRFSGTKVKSKVLKHQLHINYTQFLLLFTRFLLFQIRVRFWENIRQVLALERCYQIFQILKFCSCRNWRQSRR
jgi:hypothetical protein